MRVLTHTLRGLLLMLARRRNTVLLHTQLAVLLRVSRVPSRSRPGRVGSRRICTTLLDALREIVTPLLPLVLLLAELPLLGLCECGLTVHLQGHLVLVVTLWRTVLPEATLSSHWVERSRRAHYLTMRVVQMRLAGRCVLLVVQGMASSDIDGLVLLSHCLGVVLAAHRLNVGALLIVGGPFSSWHLMRHAQCLLL